MDARCVAVAWSGGRDSTALLHATLVAATPLGLRVLALHVHHGLSALADDWVVHCERQAARWVRRGLPVELHVARLAERPPRGQSVEAWARNARYRALAALARGQGADTVLLAHHRRDQAETLLLQALRGGGVAGLAGMPRAVERDGIRWQRPWLDHGSDEIATYVRRHRLKHIEDDSNADPRYARNRLRLQVWPALTAAFGDAESALADSAAWAQEAAACLQELAALDLGDHADQPRLPLVPLFALSTERRLNALRHWLRGRLGEAPPASLLARWRTELTLRGSARWPVDGGELRSHRGVLRHVPARPATTEAVAHETRLRVARPGRYALPGWGGALQVRAVDAGGVPLAWLGQLELRPRRGGERFQAGIGRPPRSLKKQFQAGGLAAWERSGPLVYSGGQLVFVPGLGLDARVIGLPGQALVTLDWQAADTAGQGG